MLFYITESQCLCKGNLKSPAITTPPAFANSVRGRPNSAPRTWASLIPSSSSPESVCLKSLNLSMYLRIMFWSTDAHFREKSRAFAGLAVHSQLPPWAGPRQRNEDAHRRDEHHGLVLGLRFGPARLNERRSSFGQTWKSALSRLYRNRF